MSLETKISRQRARALRYAKMRLRVVPMHRVRDGYCTCHRGKACERPGKHPMTAQGVKDATTERDQIKSWWTVSPNANIGIATGAESRILVLDIDRRHGGMKTLRRLRE